MSRKRVMRGHAVTVAVAVLVAFGWLAAWIIGAGDGPSFNGSYKLQVALPSAAGLGTGANVTIAGLHVGRVESIERRGTGALLQLKLDKDRGPLPTDSQFGVRLRSLVGENYVELYPGKAKTMLADGGLLAPGQARDYVDVDQILDALRGSARVRARQTISGLGKGVDGRAEELNQTLGGAAGVITQAAPVVTTLARNREHVARLTDELGVVASTIGSRGASIRSLAVGLRNSAQAIAQRDDAVRATLQRLPGTLAQIRQTSGVLKTVSNHATPVVVSTADAVRDLGPAIRQLRPAAVRGRALVNEIGKQAPALSSTLRRLAKLSGPATRTLPALQSTLCQVNPALRYLSPYAKEFGVFFQSMGSATNFYDAEGHAARLFASVGPNSAKLLGQGTSEIVQKLLAGGVLSPIYKLGYNPFPAPGAAGETAPANAPAGSAQVKQPYPQVKADC